MLQVHSVADPAAIRRFWDLGIGVYSDDPFPPLGAGPSTLTPPRFGGPTRDAAPPA